MVFSRNLEFALSAPLGGENLSADTVTVNFGKLEIDCG